MIRVFLTCLLALTLICPIGLSGCSNDNEKVTITAEQLRGHTQEEYEQIVANARFLIQFLIMSDIISSSSEPIIEIFPSDVPNGFAITFVNQYSGIKYRVIVPDGTIEQLEKATKHIWALEPIA